MVLALLLTTTLIFSAGTISWADEILLNKRILKGEPAPFDGTIYNVPADDKINEKLYERLEYKEGLEEEANLRRRDWVIFGAGGTVIGFVLGVLVFR